MYYCILFNEINSPDSNSQLPDGVIDDKDTDLEHISKDGLFRYRLINGNSEAVIIHHYLLNPTSLEIPTVLDGFLVVGIGKKAFAGLQRLEKLTLPKFIKYIGEGAFNGCCVTELEFPESVSLICKSAFSNCQNLEDVKGLDYLVHHDESKRNHGSLTVMVRVYFRNNRVYTLDSDLGLFAFDNCPLLRLKRLDLIEYTTGSELAIKRNEFERRRVKRETHSIVQVLNEAIAKNDCEKVRLLIQENPWLINGRFGENMQSLLILAVIHNKMEILECLSSLGASLLVKDKGGNNILHYAVRYADYQLFTYIVERLNRKIDFDTPNNYGHPSTIMLGIRFEYLYPDQVEGSFKILKVLLKQSSLVVDHDIVFCALQFADVDVCNLLVEHYEGDFTLKDLELAEQTIRHSAAWDEMVKRCSDKGKEKRDFNFLDYEDADDNGGEIELNKKYSVEGEWITTAPGLEWHYTLRIVKKEEDLWSFRITDIDYKSVLGFYMVEEGIVNTVDLCRLVSEGGMVKELYSWAKTHKIDQICELLRDIGRRYDVELSEED